MASPQEFAQQYGPLAASVGKNLGVSPEILLGQWGLETGWGRSVIPGTNNLGNIKDFSGAGVGATDNMTGSRDNYRAYETADAFGQDFAGLIGRRYKGAMGVGDDAQKWAEALKAGGYAEDPDYVRKVVAATDLVRKSGGIGDRIAAAVLPSAQAAEAPQVGFSSKIEQARKAGYSDAEIMQHLTQSQGFSAKLKQARDAGYTEAEIFQHLGLSAAQEQPAPRAVAVAPRGGASGSWDEPSTRENLARGVRQGLTDVFAGTGQNAAHDTLRLIESIAPNSALAERARQQAASADQEAQSREQAYQSATPGSTAAGVGRVAGNIAIGGAGGGQLINVGRQAGVRLAETLGGNALAKYLSGGLGASGGSAVLSGGWAGAQPVSEAGDFDALKNRQIGMGAGVGAFVPGAGALLRGGGQAVGAVGRTARNLVQPLSAKGQGNIADRIIREAARGGPTNVNSAQIVPGSQPTLAQATGNPNLAALERGLRNDPRLTNEILARDTANAAARRQAFDNVAGDSSKLDFFRAHRETTANNLYGDAIASYTGDTTPFIKGQITQLLKRPSINKASRKAQQWAIERGEKPDPKGSLRALHDVKGALDDMIGESVRKGAGGEAKALQATKAKLLDVMERMSPEYGLARQTYAEMSRPVNAMELLQGLKLTDARGNFTLAKVQSAIDSITKQRNMPGVNSAKSLNADELGILTAIRDDLLRESNTGLGRAAGSPTMQNIAIENLLNDLGPGGNRLAQSFIGGLTKRLGNVVYGGTDEHIRNALLDRLMDPRLGAAALNGGNAGMASQLTNNALYRALTPYLLPAGAVGTASGSSSR